MDPQSTVVSALPSPFVPHGYAMDEATRKVVDDITARLSAPFAESAIDWVVKEEDIVAEKGAYRARCFAFVNARAVMERLDEVFGSFYWKSNLQPAQFVGAGRQGFVCELSIMLPGIGWLTKSDAAELTARDPVKGGASGAFKRAAVLFGVGRYLYELGESYADFCPDGRRQVRFENKVLRWNPPLLPAWALPKADQARRDREIRQRAWRALSAWIEKGGQLGEEPKLPPSASEPKAEPAANPAPAIQPQATEASHDAHAASETKPEAEAQAPRNAEANGAKVPGMTLAMLAALKDLLGDDTRLNLAYLKQKKFLPAGATEVSQLPLACAEKILAMKDQVKPKMATLRAISAVIAGRDEQADAIFTGKGFIKPGARWFEANEAGLAYARDNSDRFSAALERAAKKATSAQAEGQQAAA